ncbi:hypothetical protein [Duganella sp. P38]|uniref:hypothetical protein n=1 Tax=Duganella sp. P38 TaxID=3423949 RepID=UPI003D7B4F8E
MNSTTSPDNTPTVIAIAQQLVAQLSDMYYQLGISSEVDAFYTEIFEPMMELQPDPNEIEDGFETTNEISNIDMIRLSCAYVVGALHCYGTDDENSWLGVSHAQYWMGVAYGLGFTQGLVKKAFVNRAKSGGAQRKERYTPLRELARELAEKGDPVTNKPFPSRRQAALKIKDQILAASVADVRLKPDQAERTITSWLSDMQFGSKSKR